jgi:hypothetical protein
MAAMRQAETPKPDQAASDGKGNHGLCIGERQSPKRSDEQERRFDDSRSITVEKNPQGI